MKKILILLLAAAMLLTAAACTGDGGSQGGGDADTGGAGASDGEAADSGGVTDSTGGDTAADDGAADDGADAMQRFRDAYAKYDPDAVVFTVNGESVVWSDYFSWLYSIVNQIESYYGQIDWSTALDEEYTYNSYALEYAEASAAQYLAIVQSARENGVELSDEDRAEIETLYQSDIQTYGGSEEVFEEMLSEMFITLDYYFFMGEASYYYSNFFEAAYGIEGASLSDEDAVAFAEDSGYLHAKHILFKTIDDNREPLPDDVIAQKRADAEAALAELQACATREELLTRFDELMHELSEDGRDENGVLAAPDGYYFTDGEMIQEFEDGTKALGHYEISGIVEGAYGYHIILRLPIDPDDVIDASTGVTFRYAAASSLYGNMVTDLVQNAEIEYQNGFDTLDINELLA